MTLKDRDYEDIIRSALSAAAESVEPAGDGLQKIRHRLNSPRSARSRLASFTEWFMLQRIRLSVQLEPVTSMTRSGISQLGQMFTGTAPGHRGAPRPRARHRTVPGRLASARPWLRPVLAVSAVVAIVMVGFVTLHTVQQAVISPANSVGSPGSRSASAQPDPTGSTGLYPSLGVTGSSSVQNAIPPAPVPTSTLPASAPSPTSSASATANASTPTPTTSPTSTSTAAPTPTATTSGSGASATPSPSGTSGPGTSDSGSSGSSSTVTATTPR